MANGEYDHQAMKRFLDILCLATERVVNEQNSLILTATKNSSLRKRNLDEYVSQQNPNLHASSSSVQLLPYKKRFVVKEKEQVVREREPPVKKRGPFRREARVLERPAVTPEWLVNLMREENGFDAKMIFEKELTATDLNQLQGRLLIPSSQIVEKDFLNKEEKRIIWLHHRGGDKKGLDVIFVGPLGHKCELNLRIWDMKSSSNYVLVSGWYTAAVDNRLRVGQIIRLWSFHSPQRLFFALAPPNPAPALALALPPPPVPPPLARALVPAPALSPEALAPLNHDCLCTCEDCLEAQEERDKLFANYPKRRRSIRVPVSPPHPAFRDSDHDGQIRREDTPI